MRKNYLTPSLRATRLSLILIGIAATLTGCASPQSNTAANCPEPPQEVQVPASLLSKSSPDAQSFSKKVQNYSMRVADFLEE